ncbi:MAG: ComEC/Rec2 family competence protein, partial [Limnobacter sp.]|nr:ComEC/Rec2 family competence protein [Limnobacter sp.]
MLVKLTNKPSSPRLARLGLLFLTSSVAAYSLGSLQAQKHLPLRIQPDCHRQVQRAVFELKDVSLKGENEVALLLESTGPSRPCLQKGTLLQARAELQRWPIGALYEIEGALRSPRAALQFQGFDVEFYWMAKGIHGHLQMKSPPVPIPTDGSWNVLQALKQQRLNTTLWLLKTLPESPSRALLVALITGDQGLLTPTDRQLFADTGIAHLVAISGLHVTLLALAFGKCIGWIWRRNRWLMRALNPHFAGPLCG